MGGNRQPYNVTIGIICEAFGCLPSQVEDEDWAVIRDVLDYRLLASARDQHNQDASGMQPSQVAIWQEMVQAVEGEDGSR